MNEEIEDRLIDRISFYDPSIERTEVIDTVSRDIDPIATTWVGASVIPKLDIMKEYWIRRNKYLGNIIKKSKKPAPKESQENPKPKSHTNEKSDKQQRRVRQNPK